MVGTWDDPPYTSSPELGSSSGYCNPYSKGAVSIRGTFQAGMLKAKSEAQAGNPARDSYYGLSGFGRGFRPGVESVGTEVALGA